MITHECTKTLESRKKKYTTEKSLKFWESKGGHPEGRTKENSKGDKRIRLSVVW